MDKDFSMQVRAARALLAWSQSKLADASNISVTTLNYFENDRRDPSANNLAAIRRVLEDAGIEFIPAKSGKGVGVRLRKG